MAENPEWWWDPQIYISDLCGLDYQFPDWSTASLAWASVGDYSLLAERIKDGNATQAERKLASDIILKSRKPNANRPAKKFMRDVRIFRLVEQRMADGYLKDAAVHDAEVKFKLKNAYKIVGKVENRSGRKLPRRRK